MGHEHRHPDHPANTPADGEAAPADYRFFTCMLAAVTALLAAAMAVVLILYFVLKVWLGEGLAR